MRTSEELNELYSALIAVRADIRPLAKDKSGFGYKYVTLDSVLDMLSEALPKHNLGFTQWPTIIDGNFALLTRVFHVSGQWMEDLVSFDKTSVKGTNDTQQLGASITYFRRYALTAIFGIAADEDVDGNPKRGDQAKSAASKPKSTKMDPSKYIIDDAKKRRADHKTILEINSFYCQISSIQDTFIDEIDCCRGGCSPSDSEALGMIEPEPYYKVIIGTTNQKNITELARALFVYNRDHAGGSNG